MRCPVCRSRDEHVVDSRTFTNGLAVRRRRLCNACGARFTTYEQQVEHADKDLVHELTLALEDMQKVMARLQAVLRQRKPQGKRPSNARVPEGHVKYAHK